MPPLRAMEPVAMRTEARRRRTFATDDKFCIEPGQPAARPAVGRAIVALPTVAGPLVDVPTALLKGRIPLPGKENNPRGTSNHAWHGCAAGTIALLGNGCRFRRHIDRVRCQAGL
jgi:hypothetical protein